MCPRIMLTGGFNQKGFVESDRMLDAILKLGVPREDVLIERASKNTGENVLCALPVIDVAVGSQIFARLPLLSKTTTHAGL